MPLIEKQRAYIREETRKTHQFIEKLVAEGKAIPLNPAKEVTTSLHTYNTGTRGRKSKIDIELERYWYPSLRF